LKTISSTLTETSSAVSISIPAISRIVQPASVVKEWYESITKFPDSYKPLSLYREGLIATSIFESFRSFYRVIECYKPKGSLQNYEPFTSIRGRLSHGEKNKKLGAAPILLESSEDDRKFVEKHLVGLRNEARKLIFQYEGI